MENQKVNTVFNVFVGVIATSALIASTYIAMDVPLLKFQSQLSGYRFTGKGYDVQPKLRLNLTTQKNRLYNYLYHVHQLTLESPYVSVDAQCLQDMAKVSDNVFDSAVHFSNVTFNMTNSGDETKKLGDLDLRADILLGTTFQNHIVRRGNFIENEINYTKLRGGINVEFTNKTPADYRRAINKCINRTS